MAVIKIRMHTDQKSNDARYKRFVAPREGFIDIDSNNGSLCVKEGNYKCKPWDTSISRKNDPSYIDFKRKLHSGLCFESKKQAVDFMEKHKEKLNELAKTNPIFHHWSIMSVMKRFEPTSKLIYNKDTKGI
jgi:hypothetical protein